VCLPLEKIEILPVFEVSLHLQQDLRMVGKTQNERTPHMTSRKNLFLLCTFALLLVSCGGDNDGTGIVSEDDRFTSEFKFTDIINGATLRCHENFCPSGAVKLAARHGSAGTIEKTINGEVTQVPVYKYSWCSGFLIDKRTIVTNGHCIPDQVKYQGASCSDELAVMYINGSRTENIRCSRILNVIHNEKKDQDFAVFQLDRNIPVSPIKVEKRGLLDGSSVTAVVVDHGEIRRGGFSTSYIRNVECKVVYNSIVYPLGTSPFSHSYALGDRANSSEDCKVISGNSGSGLFDTQSRHAVGVVSHTVYKDKAREIVTKLPGELETWSISSMGLATNLACIPLPVGNRKMHEQCPIDYKQITDREYVKNSKGRISEKVDKSINDYFPQLPGGDLVSWAYLGDATVTFDNTKISFLPKCIERWNIEKLIKRGTKIDGTNSYSYDGKIYQTKDITSTPVFNKYLVVSNFSFKSRGLSKRARLTMDYTDAIVKKSVIFSLSVGGSADQEGSIPLCDAI
jgi:V8-like Glu-specific endopeptidase